MAPVAKSPVFLQLTEAATFQQKHIKISKGCFSDGGLVSREVTNISLAIKHGWENPTIDTRCSH